MNDREPSVDRLQAAHSLLKTNPQQAVQELETLAEMGSAMAPLYLGWSYHNGDDLPKSNEKAEYWLKQSLARGELLASYYLGHFYSSLERYAEANIAYEQGSEAGYLPSTYCLAMNLLEGRPEPKNMDIAKQLLENAANRGHAFAMRALATLYLSGRCGNMKIAYGVWLWLRAIWRGLLVAMRDVDDDRLRT